MNATASMPIPIPAAIRCMQASLLRSPTWTWAIFNSLPRAATSGLIRALTSASSIPASRSSTSPMPSWTWKDLVSWPSLA